MTKRPDFKSFKEEVLKKEKVKAEYEALRPEFELTKDSSYTKCWKCTNNIPTQKDCYYLRTRDGNYYFCETCYKGFCLAAEEYIQKDKSAYNDILRIINKAIIEWHDNHHEETEICETCKRINELLREKLYPNNPNE